MGDPYNALHSLPDALRRIRALEDRVAELERAAAQSDKTHEARFRALEQQVRRLEGK